MPNEDNKEDNKLVIPWEPTRNEIKRDERGHFLPGTSGNKGNQSPGQLVARWFQKALAEIDVKDPQSRPKLEALFDNMFDIANNKDAKYRKEAVWAFNAIMDRAFGPPIKDKSELDAMAQQGGVKIQVVAIGELPPSAKPQVKPQLKPPTEWVEGEIIE